MSSTTFFSAYVGPKISERVEVTEKKTAAPYVAARVVVLDLEAGKDSVEITAAQAMKLGRALIKAGKYSEKMAKPLELGGFTARQSGMVGGDNEHALGSS